MFSINAFGTLALWTRLLAGKEVLVVPLISGGMTGACVKPTQGDI